MSNQTLFKATKKIGSDGVILHFAFVIIRGDNEIEGERQSMPIYRKKSKDAFLTPENMLTHPYIKVKSKEGLEKIVQEIQNKLRHDYKALHTVANIPIPQKEPCQVTQVQRIEEKELVSVQITVNESEEN